MDYKRQVALLLNVLPEVAKEDCFALHGGTAINLFIRDMPRLSVGIDLTYVPIEKRPTSLKILPPPCCELETVSRNSFLIFRWSTSGQYQSCWLQPMA